jgi:uncharacterized protein YqgC (DUF456 family)
MWETVALVSLTLCCMLAVAMTALRLPGPWLIVIGALLYGWWADWEPFGLLLIGLLVLFGALGEAAEFLGAVLTARKAGASRQAAWGGLIGGLLGVVFLASICTVPFPLIGTLIGAVIGAMIGCFAGATIVELWLRREVAQGARVGLFSALGMALGTAAKLAVAMAMSALVMTAAVCSGPSPVGTDSTAVQAPPEDPPREVSGPPESSEGATDLP